MLIKLLPVLIQTFLRLLHRIQSNHISFRVMHQRDEAVGADRGFGFEDVAAVFGGAVGFDRAIGSGEIDEGAREA